MPCELQICSPPVESAAKISPFLGDGSDCLHCGNNQIFVALVHTDSPWEDLSREGRQLAVCNYAGCSYRGLPQKLLPTRVQNEGTKSKLAIRFA